MGFFAISSRESNTSFEIEACHLTFWVLPRHFMWRFERTHNYAFDIGLRIKPSGPLRRFKVALPFDSEGARIRDLSAFVLDPNFAPLIFGRPTNIVDGRIQYEAGNLGQGNVGDRVAAICEQTSSAMHESDFRFSVWTIELTDPINPNEMTYVRFRIQPRTAGALWTDKGWGFAKKGIIVDLRIADIRESILLNFGRQEANYLVPLKRLFLFLGLPSSYVPNHYSPPLHYSRLLESQVWKNYLDGRYRRDAQISIHQWRSRDAGMAAPEPIDKERPYRAYMDLTREFGWSLGFWYFLTAAGGAIFGTAVKFLLELQW